MRTAPSPRDGVSRAEYEELVARVAALEVRADENEGGKRQEGVKQANPEPGSNKGIPSRVKAKQRKTAPLGITTNEAGYCIGDIIKVTKDRNYFTGKRNWLEGEIGTVCDVTAKFVRVRLKDNTEKMKKNHNVTLVQAKYQRVKYRGADKQWYLKEEPRPEM